MAIKKIEIRNVKSLKQVCINTEDITCLIGKNGVGKTNIQKCINYFYDNLTSTNIDSEIYDRVNPYNHYAEISITYDLSKFFKIAKNSSSFTNVFFKKLKILFKQKRTNIITLTLQQYKDNRIVWNEPSYEIRSIIKYLFPIYFVQARNINLTDWENLWNIIGYSSQTKGDTTKNLSEELTLVLEDIFGSKQKENFNNFKKEMENHEFKVHPFSMANLFAELYKIQLGGEIFKFQDKDLAYFSDGSNSYNYIKFLFLVIDKLNKNKLKSPLIILDEPEIGLHPKLIDELMELIVEKSKMIQTIIATHSPRVIKCSVGNENLTVYQLSRNKEYTKIKKIKALSDKRELNTITDKEASYYFSDGILFVEGVTELELFSNRYVREIFPVLKKIDIFSYDSNNVALSMSHPQKRNMDIPYLLLLDMDKILAYNYQNNKFKITGDEYNPLKNKKIRDAELLLYGKKRLELLNTRKRIEGITKKSRFKFNKNLHSSKDQLYKELMQLINDYCVNYNVYPVKTTIEGTLINLSNYTFVYEWLKTYSHDALDKVEFDALYNLSNEPQYRVNLMRILVCGKFDSLHGIEKAPINGGSDTEIRKGYHTVKLGNKIEKTDGWVNSLLNYTIYKFEKEEIKEKFRVLFPELYDIIRKIEIMME